MKSSLLALQMVSLATSIVAHFCACIVLLYARLLAVEERVRACSLVFLPRCFALALYLLGSSGGLTREAKNVGLADRRFETRRQQ